MSKLRTFSTASFGASPDFRDNALYAAGIIVDGEKEKGENAEGE